MATTTSTLAGADNYFSWLGDFLRQELQPYPGRAVAVSRMVIAASLTMIVIMTFRIHGGGLGTLYVFFIARDSFHATLKSAAAIFISYAIGVCFVLVGANLFADEPTSRFLWFSGSIFVVFFVLRTVDNFNAGLAFTLLVVNTLPVWQTMRVAEEQVERTLSQALAVAVGTLITVAVELIFRALHPKEELFVGLEGRWSALRELLTCYRESIPVPEKLMSQLDRLAITGSGGLRGILARSSYEPRYREQMTAVVALTGRLMEISSTMARMPHALKDGDKERIARVLMQLDEIQASVATQSAPPLHELYCTTISGIPLLPEILRTVNLIPQVFSGDESSSAYIPSSLNINSSSTVFVRDAFSNPEHMKFALRGCLAATLCYFTYSILDWRGLATSAATCVVTALSNVGSSRQKQILRVTGAAAGGFIFGIGSQAFILPHFDSISQFVLLFAAVTAIAAWFTTSSPRLSYFGIQLAQAFYLINVEGFTIQTSLSVARNRVVGIMLGLLVMWIVFDRIWAKPAAQEMIEVFTSNLRLIANLTKDSITGDPDTDIRRIRLRRSTIAANFQTVNAQADGIPFEFGSKRARHMLARSYIRRWQPSLRTLYLMELALLQHRLFGAEVELPDSVLKAQYRFNNACAQMLTAMADRIQGDQVTLQDQELDAALRDLEASLASSTSMVFGITLARVHGLIHLSQQISSLLREAFLEVMTAPRIGRLI